MIRNISIVIPVLNEADTLPEAVSSLLASGYPSENIELVMVDGGSVDGTLTYIEELTQSNTRVQLLHNANKTTPYALNLGISSASHDIILRADAHAVYWPNYIENSVAALIENKGDNVGGRVLAKSGQTEFSKVLAMVLNSRFGNGGASYRAAKEGKLVDTVWCGCWFKKTLEDVGFFDPNWVNNQDAELNARMLSRGLKVYFDPTITAELVVRSSMRKMLLQYYGYGKGRLKTLLRYPGQVKFRQVLPILGVFSAISLLVLTPVLFLVLACLVIIFGFMFYWKEAMELGISKSSLFLVMPTIFFMNLSWVSGVLAAAILSLKGYLGLKIGGSFKRVK